MPRFASLDDLIARKAQEYADQIKAAAAMADKEEEIRIESEKQLAFIQKEAGIKLEGKHEVTVASGRVDSVYSRVIIEYKNPKSPGDRIGPRADSPGSKKVVEQIKKRFYDMRIEQGQSLNSLFGVGLDGNYFIFIRFRDDKWQVQEPVEVNRVSAERFLWALFNLGSKGKAFTPEYLAGDFGSEGGNTIAIDGIHALYDAISSTDNPKAQTFFSQWKILFGEVCGYDVDNPSDKIKKLAEFYKVSLKDPKPAELLFSVHTYYALFMKLLAAEIVAFFHKLPTPLQKMMQATTSNKLKREMDDLEAGSIFRHLNITNFLEGDLFAWYTGIWTAPIEKLVREMVTRLDDYNPGTLSEDPSGSRDLLKKLYQQLFPKSVRHDLGEYYTPDWLADHVLNELGYVGDPDKRLLDPACGSGTFLVMAINQIRKWYDANRERCPYDEGELCRKILANVIGFDLNPLAVMAARTNYLIAIRDLIGHVDEVEIPVFLCDSILTPTEYGDLFTSRHGVAKELKTAAARFLIPTEITGNRATVAKYAEVLEFCVKNQFSTQEFLHPVARGKDIERWFYKGESVVLMVQDPDTRRGYKETWLKRQCPLTYAYLRGFKEILESRAAYLKYHAEGGHAFYSMFNISSDTFAPFKVAWRRMGVDLRATVLSEIPHESLGARLVVASDTVTIVPLQTEEEANYLAGLLNSTPCRSAVYSYSPPGRGLGTPAILQSLRIDRFDQRNSVHKEIARIARTLTKLHARSHLAFSAIEEAELELDNAVSKYWGLSAKELVELKAMAEERESAHGPRHSGRAVVEEDMASHMFDIATSSKE